MIVKWIKKNFINADTWPTYSDAVSSGWEELSISLIGGSWISELAWNSTETWALYSSKYGGNAIEPIGDICNRAGSNDSLWLVAIGGCAWNTTDNGSFNWVYSIDISSKDYTIGGRSIEIVS